jgi:SAM-dependent methyltransferase
MKTKGFNSYEDDKRAAAYAALEFSGSYYLAFRDLPEIISRYVRGNRAIDFGCGAGRSTRFLKKLDFKTVGIDIAENMIAKARELDPGGEYYLAASNSWEFLGIESYDLILAAFTFDNIPGRENKAEILRNLRRLLKGDGIMAAIVSNPEIYTHEWASFSTKDFPENKRAQSGDIVKIIIIDIDDSRPVEDIVCSDDDYRSIFRAAGFALVETRRPLATGDEPYHWINETVIPPWTIYALRKL